MNRMQEQVLEFMLPGKYPICSRGFGYTDFQKPVQLPTGEVTNFREYLLRRCNWIKEEENELRNAIENNDVIETVDALADLLYFVFGTAISMGIDIEKFFDIVHKSNMAKFIPCPRCLGIGKIPLPRNKTDIACPTCSGHRILAIYRKSDGKLIKPVDWQAPDLTHELTTQQGKLNVKET